MAPMIAVRGMVAGPEPLVQPKKMLGRVKAEL